MPQVRVLPPTPTGLGQLTEAFTTQFEKAQERQLKQRELEIKEEEAGKLSSREILDKIELDNVLRQRGISLGEPVSGDIPTGFEEAPIGRDAQVQTVEQNVARVIGGQTDTPTPFVQIPDGADKFGVLKTKTVTNPDYKLYETAKIKEINADAEVLKLGKKAKANFGRSTAMFSNLISQIKGAAEEQGGLGIGPGVVGGMGAKFRIPGFGRAAAISGQITETSLGLNSILTGQNRVIRSVVSMIRDTLPTRFNPEDQVAAKVAQSISNSYRLVKAFEKAGLTPEALKAMSNEELDKIDAPSLIATFQLGEDEQDELERIIGEVLSAPPTKARTLEGKPRTIPKTISPDLKIRAIEELRRRGEL